MATLKISDLSVGDWVRVINQFDAQIDGYHSRSGSLSLKTRQGNLVHYRLEDIHPIPITAEILEKNGFVKNGEYDEWNIGNWNDIPFIGISLSRQSMRIKNLRTDIFLENKVVYVHQLQCALRLAGVDKKINL